ncbi:GNAT family N-acetyltransferase [Streptacidiphilus jiangxiensis]|uniref:Acetyltransferase (GNAT) family protein n=1 Tax=Streptacidiphilus jiangxiensis TaxID=235985 RepID=A0A1H7M2E7_STRJI|nr:GNAT family N-acetyltransferase [Streptacidiphilus jiangxiensis]SEL05269.1 Acetyltransferase (GNAT) family protein [Streptacidiphilus jiangxiensis]
MGGGVVVIGPAAAEEVGEALAVWQHSHMIRRNGRPLSRAHVRSAYARMAAPGAMLLLAREEGRREDGGPGIIGTVLGVQGLADDGAGPPQPGLLHLSLLSVAPDRWGQRVGRRLIERVVAEGRERGFTEAQLWTHADNLRANRLYRVLGFRRTGRVKIDDWGELLVHYRRTLGEA